MKTESTLQDVTDQPDLWVEGDPVRPGLGPEFKSALGRRVYGLLDPGGDWGAFCCTARTIGVPRSVAELDRMTDLTGMIIVPYTVWSLRRGAGKEIIRALIATTQPGERVVTLSPKTEMAARFHDRNGATRIGKWSEAVNFEYPTGGAQ